MQNNYLAHKEEKFYDMGLLNSKETQAFCKTKCFVHVSVLKFKLPTAMPHGHHKMAVMFYTVSVGLELSASLLHAKTFLGDYNKNAFTTKQWIFQHHTEFSLLKSGHLV